MMLRSRRELFTLKDACKIPQIEEMQRELHSFKKDRGYRELTQALCKYYYTQSIDKLTLHRMQLIRQINQFIHYHPHQPLDAMKTLRHALCRVQQSTASNFTSRPLAKKIHFISIGQTVIHYWKPYLLLWQRLHAPLGYQLYLWHDSDAQLVETLNHAISQQIRRQPHHTPPPLNSNPLFSILQSTYKAQQSAHTYIQQAMATGGSADQARSHLLTNHYRQPLTLRSAQQKRYQETLKHLTGSGITVCDIQEELPTWQLRDHYQHELQRRGNTIAAVNIASLQLLAKWGGIYCRQNSFPPLNTTIWNEIVQHIFQKPHANTIPPQINMALWSGQEWRTAQDAQFSMWMLIQTQLSQLLHGMGYIREPLSHLKDKRAIFSRMPLVQFLQNDPPLSTLFSPLPPLIFPDNEFRFLSDITHPATYALLAAHANSTLLQSVLQQVARQYQWLEQINQQITIEDLSHLNRACMLQKIIPRFPALPLPSLRAIVEYYAEGILADADATRYFSGPGILQQGLLHYAQQQLIPAHLMQIEQRQLPPGTVYSSPLRGETHMQGQLSGRVTHHQDHSQMQ